MKKFRPSISLLPIKIWMIFVILSLMLLTLLVITIFNTAPRVNVIPQLFSPDVMHFNHFVEATNMQAPIKERKLIEEMLVRFYVENRNNYIPNLYEMSYRYGENGPIARLSSPAVFRQFQGEIGNFAEKMQEKTDITTKTVDIIRLTRQDNTFTVDFDVYQFDGNKVSFGGSRRAVVKISYAPEYRHFSADFVNPYGIIVNFYKESFLKKR